MLWTKQYYYFDLDKWLQEHEAHPLTGTGHRNMRNTEWFHMLNSDIISMPDKWEYPVVCGMGPGFSHHCPFVGRLRFCQGPTSADAAEPVCSPEWADSSI